MHLKKKLKIFFEEIFDLTFSFLWYKKNSFPSTTDKCTSLTLRGIVFPKCLWKILNSWNNFLSSDIKLPFLSCINWAGWFLEADPLHAINAGWLRPSQSHNQSQLRHTQAWTKRSKSRAYLMCGKKYLDDARVKCNLSSPSQVYLFFWIFHKQRRKYLKRCMLQVHSRKVMPTYVRTWTTNRFFWFM